MRRALAAALALSLAACTSPGRSEVEERPRPPRPAPPPTLAPAAPAAADEAAPTGASADAESGAPKAGAPAGGAAEGRAAEAAASLDDAVLGTVAGRPLSAGELLREWNYDTIGEAVALAERLTSGVLALAEAERLGVRLDAELVAARQEEALAELERNTLRLEGRPLDDFLRDGVGLDPEGYRAYVRRATTRKLLLERVVRAWTLSNETAAVRIVATRERAEAEALRARAEAGEDLAALAREASVDDSRARGGLVPFVLRMEESPLARLAFAAPAGELVGPVEAADHWLLLRVEEVREPAAGRWREIGALVEASVAAEPITDLEYLAWKLTMQRRYPVDLAPLWRALGAAKGDEPPGERF